MSPKTKETPHLRVRIEPRLLARLEKAREKNGRTLTGEIVHRIEQSFRKDDTERQLAASGAAIAEIMLKAQAAGKLPTKEEMQQFIAEVIGQAKQGD